MPASPVNEFGNPGLSELNFRWERCRALLREYLPRAEGLLVFSRLNIFYLSGTFGNGVFWLPLEGDPVFLSRRGADRARIESPLRQVIPFTSYRDLEAILKQEGSPLPNVLAAEMNGLSWALSNSLTRSLSNQTFHSGDRILAMARAGKSQWERDILREAGKRHAACLTELLPLHLHEGITELEVAHTVSRLFFEQGHHGILRMDGYGEEVFLGHISMGDSGNYPSVFNGPLGLRGAHPAVPHMGSAEKHWKPGEPLTIDNGFTLAGYQTDKTQVYWLGDNASIPAKALKAQDFCTRMQAWIASHLRPGALPSDLWARCRAWADKDGWAEGFMGLGGNKVRFVGHGIGLAVDEYPVLAEGFDLPLEEGMVLAVEPKIGLPDFGMVGVENTFEVTPGGGKSLTGDRYEIICIPK